MFCLLRTRTRQKQVTKDLAILQNKVFVDMYIFFISCKWRESFNMYIVYYGPTYLLSKMLFLCKHVLSILFRQCSSTVLSIALQNKHFINPGKNVTYNSKICTKVVRRKYTAKFLYVPFASEAN